MRSRDLLEQIAATDRTFQRAGDRWIGKCLICGGRLAFAAASGEGATVEHILPRSKGGDNDLRNLGIAHPGCNHEKGVHWDARKGRRLDPARYDAILTRLRTERARRWREPEA